MNRLFLFMLTAALLAVAAGCAPRVKLTGRVIADDNSLAGARVILEDVKGAVVAETVTDEDGEYIFEQLKPGSYNLKTVSADGATGTVSGRNPLLLASGAQLRVGMKAEPIDKVTLRKLGKTDLVFGELSGTLLHRGEPVKGGVVNLYLDRSGELRGPGFAQSFPTGGDGGFLFLDLAEGEYYVTGRKRRTGASGPVREGDLYGELFQNPVKVFAGSETRLTLRLVKKEKPVDLNNARMALFSTGITGIVVDEKGEPAKGVYVFAYRNRVIGHQKPDFLTEPTGEDGRFSLPLGSGGLFYLGGREKFGFSPTPGELFGLYEGSADHGLRVKEGTVVENVEIVVHRVLE